MAARRVRRTAVMRDAGPFKVQSHLGGTLHVFPSWSGLYGKPGWRRRTDKDEATAGGPGFFSRMGLAEHVERFLNGPYEAAAIDAMQTDDDLRDEYVVTRLATLRLWRDDPAALAKYIEQQEKYLADRVAERAAVRQGESDAGTESAPEDPSG